MVESNASDSADSESDDAQTVDTTLSDEPIFESDLNSDDSDDSENSENLNENMYVNEETHFVQELQLLNVGDSKIIIKTFDNNIHGLEIMVLLP